MKKYKPTSPGRRDGSTIEYKKKLTSTANKPHKSLVKGKRSTGGRNSQGRITNWYRGGGAKRKYREVDFKFDKKDIKAKIESVEYDPYRSGFVALVVYADGERRYILVPQKMQAGDTFTVSEKAKAKTGNRLPLGNAPVGTFVYAIELKPGAGARLARSAGNYAEVVAHDAGYTQLKLPSSEGSSIAARCEPMPIAMLVSCAASARRALRSPTAWAARPTPTRWASTPRTCSRSPARR